MRLYYAVLAQKPTSEREHIEFTETLLRFYQDLKKITSAFEAVVMMTDKNTNEYQILAISIEVEEGSWIIDQIKNKQEIFMSSATEAGVVVKINTYEATMCDDNFAMMLRALNPATI